MCRLHPFFKVHNNLFLFSSTTIYGFIDFLLEDTTLGIGIIELDLGNSYWFGWLIHVRHLVFP